MNKAELIDSIIENTEVTKTDATKVLNATFEEITNVLTGGDQVIIPGFGTFATSHRAARTGRNPQTGESINIDAKRVVKFKAGKCIKRCC